MNAYHLINPSLPKTYDEIIKHVYSISCIPLFVRKVPQCCKCRKYIDDGHQFCPNCLSKDPPEKVIIWQQCSTRGCICHKTIKNVKDMTVDQLKEYECSHSKRPVHYYFLYCPPAGIIADSIHFGLWNEYIGLDIQSLMDIQDYSQTVHSHSVFTTKNMAMICEKLLLKQLADRIEQGLIFNKTSTIVILEDLSSNHKTLSSKGRILCLFIY